MRSSIRSVIAYVVENLADSLTVTLAAYVVYRHRITPLDIGTLVSWMVALLGLVAVSGMVQRNVRGRRLEELVSASKASIDRYFAGKVRAADFLLSDTVLDASVFVSAQRIVLTGVTLQSRVRQLLYVLEKRLKAGASVQLVLLDATASNLEQMRWRGWGDATAEYYTGLLNGTLTRLRILAEATQGVGKLEVRLAPFYPSMAFEMVDPDEDEGVCWVTMLPHRTTRSAAVFRLRAKEDVEWYDFCLEQFRLLWEASREADLILGSSAKVK